MSMNDTASTPSTSHSAGGSRPRALTLLSVAVILLAIIGVVVLGLMRRGREAAETRSRTTALAKGSTVQVAKVEVSPSEQTLSLPAEVRGWAQTTLYAKVAGYVRDIPVDKGTRVKKGELIARLESPETDQAVLAARADLELKRQLNQRTQALRPDNVVSQQDADNTAAALRVSEANLQQALAMQAYEIIRAPFDGVVTARYVDVGALVPAGTGSTQSAQPVVDVADIDRLRIQIYLGQSDAARLQVGDAVSLVSDSDPSHPIQAKVSRVAMGLDSRTRTMLAEADLDNRPPKLFPGQFVRATLKLHGARTPLVPGEALAWRGDKLNVAIVQDGKVRLQPVTPGDDNGKLVQVLAGLEGGELVVLNPSAELSSGDQVQVTQPPPAPAQVNSAPKNATPGAGLPAAR
jgi:membrane fusion protein (multidrug efflux system)